MSTYTFKKVSGGGKVQKDGAEIHGICSMSFVVVTVATPKVHLKLLDNRLTIDAVTDTVVIDKTGVSGDAATYGPNTQSAEQLQDMIMDVFNPFSNVLTA